MLPSLCVGWMKCFNINMSLQIAFNALRIDLSSRGQPGLGIPSGQDALGRLKSPPKIMFRVGSRAAMAVFTLLRETIK